MSLWSSKNNICNCLRINPERHELWSRIYICDRILVNWTLDQIRPASGYYIPYKCTAHIKFKYLQSGNMKYSINCVRGAAFFFFSTVRIKSYWKIGVYWFSIAETKYYSIFKHTNKKFILNDSISCELTIQFNYGIFTFGIRDVCMLCAWLLWYLYGVYMSVSVQLSSDNHAKFSMKHY